jgi:chemotaxis protein histidine kinase CheA
MMGGELSVSSEINKGSTFTVDLPIVVKQNTFILESEKEKSYEQDIIS